MQQDETLPTGGKPTNGPPAIGRNWFDPLIRLRGEVDRLFDDFPARLPALQFGQSVPTPALEMVEDDDAYHITAELPGMNKDEVEITLTRDELCIAGEKKKDREERKEGFLLQERSYGAFERRIRLPEAVDADSIEASFRHGLLTVTVPKDETARHAHRRIKID